MPGKPGWPSLGFCLRALPLSSSPTRRLPKATAARLADVVEAAEFFYRTVGAARAVETPGAKSIEAVCKVLGCQPAHMIKAILYMADDQPAVAFVRGDREANEVKVKAALGAKVLHLADAEWFAKTTGQPPGYLGPVGLNVRHVIDLEVKAMAQAVCGANQKQQHLVDVSPARDLPGATWADLRLAVAGDPCPKCQAGKLRTFRGIEVGHVFYLGKKYSAKMNATFLDEAGNAQVFEMGCYGIGVSRILAAAIEQNHDARGICWPVPLAPFEVAVLELDPSPLAAQLVGELEAEGVEAEDIWPLVPTAADRVAGVCRTAIARRRG